MKLTPKPAPLPALLRLRIHQRGQRFVGCRSGGLPDSGPHSLSGTRLRSEAATRTGDGRGDQRQTEDSSGPDERDLVARQRIRSDRLNFDELTAEQFSPWE